MSNDIYKASYSYPDGKGKIVKGSELFYSKENAEEWLEVIDAMIGPNTDLIEKNVTMTQIYVSVRDANADYM